ncbi:Protein P21, putative [Ricinus communis]|uniref:Protein P21, putative n=2 Tax=Ricinus communis TaxID=3988 RepID=B9SRI3_RICCO|nr:Protein P21, putative [Ricinus communis]
MAQNPSLLLLALFFIFFTITSGQNASSTKTFTLLNNCKETIWPGIITKGNDSDGKGFPLKPGQTNLHYAPIGWSGRIWARTGCNFDKNGTGTCQTGSCGAYLNCSGPSSPPNTIAEFTLGDNDFFDISLVNGFNLPVVISPLNSKGNCSIAGCDGDLRQNCPPELSVRSDGKVIACRSACDVFNTDAYCCRGAYSDPEACAPSNYSRIFKQVCPASSSYAFDRDATSIITCSASDYVVAFCASRNQTFCSYHDNEVQCNTSANDSKALLPHGWWILMVTLPLAFILQTKI